MQFYAYVQMILILYSILAWQIAIGSLVLTGKLVSAYY